MSPISDLGVVDESPLAVRKPWNEEEYRLVEHGAGKKLCFAILWHDEVILPHPPVIRGLEETKRALLEAGHEGMSIRLILRG